MPKSFMACMLKPSLAPTPRLQNFERGMGDAQLDRLVSVLRQGRIWAVNVGENFGVSRQVRSKTQCSGSMHSGGLACV